MKYTAGFIGTGNMGGALAQCVAKAVNAEKIILSNRTEEKAKILSKSIGCDFGTNKDVAKNSEFIFIGVKPNLILELAEYIKSDLLERNDSFVIVSMAAGVSLNDLSNIFGALPIIRIMPNTPVSIGKGVTVCAASKNVSNEKIEKFKNIMSFSGKVDFIDEKFINASSALSGCGPAFVYMFIEALSDGAVECGLTRKMSIEYACQTLIGAASLVLESGKHPGELKDAVCSPGGTTIAGVHALEKNGFRNAAMVCVKAAFDKTL